MSESAITLANQHDLDDILRLALDGLTSQHSRRAYEKALKNFLDRYMSVGKPG
jgi:hypothetical protein